MRPWLAALATTTLTSAALVQAGGAPAGQMTTEQFDKLPPSYVLTIDGKRMTKAEFQAILAKVRSEAAKMRPAPSALQLAAEAARKHSASVAARNRLALQRALVAAKAMPPSWRAQALTVKAPQITDVDFEGPLSPDSELHIFGTGFGEGAPATHSGGHATHGGNDLSPSDPCWLLFGGFATPPPGAEVRLYGSFPGGYVKLGVDNWHAGCVTAVVPDVVGVLEQQASLKVAAPTGLSTAFPAPFEPTEVCTLIETQVFRCRDLSVPPANPECSLEVGTEPQLKAHHTGHVLWVDGSDGIEIGLPLKNGWKLQSAWLGVAHCIGNTVECAANLQSFEIGATRARATFTWSYWSFLDDSAGVGYNGLMQGCGPKGTPYK
ncbi:MAG TPA: hypothetical protein VMT19_13225 [Thermoanaerobaculaceae bacterium]|nr:hypothetical protein [Thermoanaerobaculaceae bacterium]